MKKSKRRLFPEECLVGCDCGCCKLVVSKYVDENYFDFVMYEHANTSGRFSLPYAIKVAWKALWQRRVNEDYMILNICEAKKLARWIIENAKETKCDTEN